ncbi:hypothetical protein M9H77_09479 [Catharanthus roseus]|uniref:Uncharacterized protein n=1 Tax=Catharanthus roseus TaxID=4058 RepID=A0ACC0C0Q2_CATRO|nr:hypothetical protein M9H77_09479 [Catharanthus roseus]
MVKGRVRIYKPARKVLPLFLLDTVKNSSLLHGNIFIFEVFFPSNIFLNPTERYTRDPKLLKKEQDLSFVPSRRSENKNPSGMIPFRGLTEIPAGYHSLLGVQQCQCSSSNDKPTSGTKKGCDKKRSIFRARALRYDERLFLPEQKDQNLPRPTQAWAEWQRKYKRAREDAAEVAQRAIS